MIAIIGSFLLAFGLWLNKPRKKKQVRKDIERQRLEQNRRNFDRHTTWSRWAKGGLDPIDACEATAICELESICHD